MRRSQSAATTDRVTCFIRAVLCKSQPDPTNFSCPKYPRANIPVARSGCDRQKDSRLRRQIEDYEPLVGPICRWSRKFPASIRGRRRYWLFARPITPQATRAPESPAGCDFRSSAFA